MQLTALLSQARTARPQTRIELRDSIAFFGSRAITEVAPWIVDPKLGAFAIRVILRAGQQGERDAALLALRAARRHISEASRHDLDWAIGTLQPAKQPVARTPRQPQRSAARIQSAVHRYGGTGR